MTEASLSMGQGESEADQPYAYNLVPYPGNAYTMSHPRRLETVGRLFGLSTRQIRSVPVSWNWAARGV